MYECMDSWKYRRLFAQGIGRYVKQISCSQVRMRLSAVVLSPLVIFGAYSCERHVFLSSRVIAEDKDSWGAKSQRCVSISAGVLCLLLSSERELAKLVCCQLLPPGGSFFDTCPCLRNVSARDSLLTDRPAVSPGQSDRFPRKRSR